MLTQARHRLVVAGLCLLAVLAIAVTLGGGRIAGDGHDHAHIAVQTGGPAGAGQLAVSACHAKPACAPVVGILAVVPTAPARADALWALPQVAVVTDQLAIGLDVPPPRI